MVQVTELAKTGSGDSGGLAVAAAPIPDAASTTAGYTITIDGAASAAFATGTNYVEVYSDTACFLVFGTNPTSGGTRFALPAGLPRHFGVEPGMKVIAVS